MPRNQHPDVRQAILETALYLVNRKGINNMSLREIARELDLSPSSLYEYFDSKEVIVDELRELGRKEFNSYFQMVASEPSPQNRLQSISLAYLRFAHEHPETFNLLFLVLPSKRKGLSEPVPADSPYGMLLTTLQDGVVAGVFDLRVMGDSESAAYSLWAMVHGMATLQNTHLVSFEADWERVARAALTVFVTGMLTQAE